MATTFGHVFELLTLVLRLQTAGKSCSYENLEQLVADTVKMSRDALKTSPRWRRQGDVTSAGNTRRYREGILHKDPSQDAMEQSARACSTQLRVGVLELTD